jgi:AcrR family transcriptional regulator
VGVRRQPGRKSSGGLPPLPERRFAQERARRTHQALLGAAGQLFVERGVRATGPADIARRAGVSVGAFYRYFEDKEAALVELIHVALERNRVAQAHGLEVWRKRLAAGEATEREFVEGVVEGATRQQALPPELLRTFVALSLEDERVAALRRAYDESERRDLARFLASVTSRRRIPSPLAAARLLDLTFEEVIRWSTIEGGRPGREVRSALVEMVYRYLFA